MNRFPLGLIGGLVPLNPSLYNAKKPKVEFYQDSAQKWRWHLYFSSDIVDSSSQGYATKELAKENLLKIELHIKYLRENNMIP